MSAVAKLIFLTHPEVQIDPSVPVPSWRLSAIGRARVQSFAASPLLLSVGRIFSSAERKAIEAAAILAEQLELGWTVDKELGENDRSATGYLPPAEFEATADRFFAAPLTSVRGWERAIDAQQRIVGAVERADRAVPTDRDVLVVSHGGVGALLLAHVSGRSIGRHLDQPGSGGGNYLVLERWTLALVAGWQQIPGP